MFDGFLSAITDPDVVMTLLSVIALLALSGFFSGSETALTAASRARLHAAEKDGDKRAPIVLGLLQTRERLIGSLLLGNNMVNILASVLMTSLMVSLFGDNGHAIALATVIMTVLILIFAEVLPKTYAITRPDQASLAVARPVSVLVKLVSPIVVAVQSVVNLVLRMFGVDSQASPWTAADEIRGTVDLHVQDGGVAKGARDQIRGILDLGELSVQDLMVHRRNVVMVDGNLPPEQILIAVLDSGHSRLPVWQDNPDNVIGVLHAKDLLRALSKAGNDIGALDLQKILRAPWFIPETTSVAQQLRAFQQKREHFAIVVDEYGALMGIITLEDILEEIVGDIQDEYDEELPGLSRNSDGSITVRGDVPIRDINRAMDWGLPDEEAVTIAGLVIHESQTIPEEKQTFAYYGYRFVVLKRERNQIARLKVSKTYEPDQRG